MDASTQNNYTAAARNDDLESIQSSLPLSDSAPSPLPAITSRRPSRPAPLHFDTLLGVAPSAAPGRSSLFDDDAPRDMQDVPGALHHQSDEHVEQLIARMGAVALVKQLAEDLARRDAQVTLVQRRAEEREVTLKRMLRDCEVSNLDIEKRLRQLDGAGANAVQPTKDAGQSVARNVGTRSGEGLDKRVAEALDDALEVGVPVSAGVKGRAQRSNTLDGWKDYLIPGLGSGRRTNGPGAVTGHGRYPPGINRDSSHGTLSSRKASVEATSNRAPSRAVSNTSRRDRGHDDIASVKSSTSVTSWALRLVTGISDPRATRGRAATVMADGDLTRSTASSLSRTQSRDDVFSSGHSGVSTISPRGSISSAHGPFGIIKRTSPEAVRHAIATVLPPNSPPAYDDDTYLSLGPVEMDNILPDNVRPPTLTQNLHRRNGSSDVLTDRFGFIYDQRRRRRQHEASTRQGKVETFENYRVNKADSLDDGIGISPDDDTLGDGDDSASPSAALASSKVDGADGQKQKTWQDYLKLSSFPTSELLSHTPSAAAPIAELTVGTLDNDSPASQITMTKRGTTTQGNPVPRTSRITSSHAILAQPSSTPTTPAHAHSRSSKPNNTVSDPVRSLLDQLTEVHDALQRDKTARWNEFLRKVRAERRRAGGDGGGGGTAAHEARPQKHGPSNAAAALAAPETLLGDGELIGVAGLGNRGKVGRAKGSEFRALVLGGIPVAYRAKVWAECSGASSLRVPGQYAELAASAAAAAASTGADSDAADAAVAQQIQMDITRTLTDNIFFRRGGGGVAQLRTVLGAYARRNRGVGYCQGMNLIAAHLLLIMPGAEDCFWVLAALVERILPPSYYDASLAASRADQAVLRRFVAELLPALSAHLLALGVELEALTFQWFLSVFTDCLSAEALFRVWDVVFCLHDGDDSSSSSSSSSSSTSGGGGGATFLFQVALALLKLNEPHLLRCAAAADVYAHINGRMTAHALSIDALVRASEALRGEVRRGVVEARRREAMEHEAEEAREREQARRLKGKGRAAASPSPLPSLLLDDDDDDDDGADAMDARIRRRTARGAKAKATATATGRPAGRRIEVVRADSSRRGSWDDAAGAATHEYGELEVRTPMPYDEEVAWRG